MLKREISHPLVHPLQARNQIALSCSPEHGARQLVNYSKKERAVSLLEAAQHLTLQLRSVMDFNLTEDDFTHVCPLL